MFRKTLIAAVGVLGAAAMGLWLTNAGFSQAVLLFIWVTCGVALAVYSIRTRAVKWSRKHRPMGLIIAFIVSGSIGALGWNAYVTSKAVKRTSDQETKEAKAASGSPESAQSLLDDLRHQLADQGMIAQPTTAPIIQDAKSTDQRIQQAVDSLSGAVKERTTRQVSQLQEERRMQGLADKMDLEFRPRLTELIQLVTDAVTKSADKELVKLVSHTAQPQLPPKLAFTTYTIQAKSIELELRERNMRFVFDGGVSWVLYPFLGRVSSPIELTPGVDLKVPQTYPSLFLQQERKDRSTPLAQIYFDPETKALAFYLSARNEIAKASRDRLDQILASKTGPELVSQMLVELLRAVRLGDI